MNETLQNEKKIQKIQELLSIRLTCRSCLNAGIKTETMKYILQTGWICKNKTVGLGISQIMSFLVLISDSDADTDAV